jgi:arylsulfatase A-like enzyme
MSALPATLITAALAAQAPTASESAPKPHNVLMVVLDDVGVDLLETYERLDVARGRPAGQPAPTPAIQRLLADEGLTFTNAWVSPKCSPTRAQLLTGKFSLRNGIGSVVRSEPIESAANPGLSFDTVLLPQRLAAAPTPYSSAAVGKWHLAAIDQLTAHPGHALGLPAGTWFDEFAGSALNLEPLVRGEGAPSGYFQWRKTYASSTGRATPCPDGTPCQLEWRVPPTAHYATVDTTEDALALMATLPEPWFLYVAYNAVHAPFHVPPTELPAAPCLAPELAPGPCELPAEGNANPYRVRCTLAALDQQLGRLLCAHDAADTTVIVVGDNGTPPDATLPPFTPDRGKGTMYEGGARVPLFIRSPLLAKERRGAVESRLVNSVDLHATVLELARAPQLASALDGVSLVPYLLRGDGPTLRSESYADGFFPNFQPTVSGAPPEGYVCSFHNQTLRDERFKLIRRVGRSQRELERLTRSEEFYDLLEGGAPDTSVAPPRPRPDWFERNDLLASGKPLSEVAQRAYERLSRNLSERYPSLVR